MATVFEKFRSGTCSLEDFRDALKKEVSKGYLLSGFNYKPEDFSSEEKAATHISQLIELGNYIALAAKAKKGDYASVKALSAYEAKAAQEEGDNTLGGYLVPEEYSSTLVKATQDASSILRDCVTVTMKSDKKNVPILDQSPAVAWHSENDAISETSAVFSQGSLETSRLDAYCVLSNEVIEDSDPAIVQILMSQFVEAMALKVDSTIFLGDGSADSAGFSGIFTAAAGYSSIMSTGSAAFSSVVVAEMVKLTHKLPAYVRNNAKFYMHSDIQKWLQLEKDPQGAYRWPPYSAGPVNIGGFPISLSHQLPSDTESAGGEPFAAFANAKFLYVGQRKNASFLVDPYSLSTKYQTILIVVQRMAFKMMKSLAFARLLTYS